MIFFIVDFLIYFFLLASSNVGASTFCPKGASTFREKLPALSAKNVPALFGQNVPALFPTYAPFSVEGMNEISEKNAPSGTIHKGIHIVPAHHPASTFPDLWRYLPIKYEFLGPSVYPV